MRRLRPVHQKTQTKLMAVDFDPMAFVTGGQLGRPPKKFVSFV
jgi:hypothetical protein